jgi:hypothetical protein
VAKAAALRRQAQLAFGIAVIALLFLLETAVAHRTQPSAASPLIWSVLGLVAAAGVARGVWCSVEARREMRRQID